MSKDAVSTMGTILDDDIPHGAKDAVHVAVIAVYAGSKYLYPGTHVHVVENSEGKLIASDSQDSGSEAIGIVDPFIKGQVDRHQKFWLYLYPRTITSLSHNWTHPAFQDKDTPQDTIYTPPSGQLAAKKWLMDFAAGYGVTYDDMVKAAKNHLERGDYFNRGNTFEGEQVPEEFWVQYERLTGVIIEDRKKQFFSCSC